MIESGKQPRLTRETCHAVRVVRDDAQQNLDGHVATKLRVAPAVHLTHATGTEQRTNLVRAELPANKGAAW